MTGGVSYRGCINPGKIPELAFGSPETSEAQNYLFTIFWKRLHHRGSEDSMDRIELNRLVAARQSLVC
jgi:hypothetical protein